MFITIKIIISTRTEFENLIPKFTEKIVIGVQGLNKNEITSIHNKLKKIYELNEKTVKYNF